MMVNRVVRAYYVAFGDFREVHELSAIEEEAYRRIEVAFWRIDQFAGASVKDLCLPEAIVIAHRVMGWAQHDVPSFSTARRSGSSFRPQGRHWNQKAVVGRTRAAAGCHGVITLPRPRCDSDPSPTGTRVIRSREFALSLNGTDH